MFPPNNNSSAQTPNPFAYQPVQSQEMYGPFTQALTQPPGTGQGGPATVSGYGGAKEALSMFASKFLEGAQAARRRQFEQSEQKKSEQSRNLDQTLAMIQNGNYTQEAKDKAFQVWTQAHYGQIDQTLNGGAQGGKSGAGKGGSKKQESSNPLIGFAKKYVEGILGPRENKEHLDYGNALHDMAAIAYDPGARIDLGKMTQEATGAISSAIESAKATAQKAGVPIDQQTLLAMPSVQKALGQFTQNRIDWRQVPEIAGLFGNVPQTMTPAEQAQLDLTRTQREKAQFELGQEQKGVREPFVASWVDAQGKRHTQTVDRNSTTGQVFQLGTEKPAELPPEVTLVPAAASAYSSQLSAESAQGRIASQERMEKWREQSRELVSRFTQGKLDQRFYAGLDMKGDAETVKQFGDLLKRRDDLSKANMKSATDRAQRDKSLAMIDQQITARQNDAEAAMQRLQSADYSPTEEPPTQSGGGKPKKDKSAAGGGNSNVDWGAVVNQLLAPDTTPAPPR